MKRDGALVTDETKERVIVDGEGFSNAPDMSEEGRGRKTPQKVPTGATAEGQKSKHGVGWS